MKTLLLAAAFALGTTGYALAADAVEEVGVVDEAYNWSGMYVGVQAGYGWSDSHHYATGDSSVTFDTDGFIGGLTAGYSYQINQVVLGVETDISYSNIEGGTFEDGSDWSCEDGCDTSVEWFGTLRGRLGYAIDRTMLYVTGGLSYGDAEASPEAPDYGGKDTLVGWTAGAGIEHALTSTWTVKAEYLYVDLGEVDLVDFGPPYGVGHATVDFNAVRIGLNYKF